MRTTLGYPAGTTANLMVPITAAYDGLRTSVAFAALEVLGPIERSSQWPALLHLLPLRRFRRGRQGGVCFEAEWGLCSSGCGVLARDK